MSWIGKKAADIVTSGQQLANGTVTAIKLAAGTVVAHLGYTPMNKAGDTVTGTLSRVAQTTLGSTAGSSIVYDTFGCNDGSNNELLSLMEIRVSDGTSWTTTGTRLQKKIDSTWMGFLEFNGGTSSGVSIGTGSSTAGPDSSGINRALKALSGGQVQMPYQPAFQATYGTGGGDNGVGTVKYAQLDLNIGSSYNSSTGRFTAPVNGNYYFWANVQAQNTSSLEGYIALNFRKNGVLWGPSEFVELKASPTGGDHKTPSGAVVVSMSAGDWVDVYASRGCRQVQCGFCGFLIG